MDLKWNVNELFPQVVCKVGLICSDNVFLFTDMPLYLIVNPAFVLHLLADLRQVGEAPEVFLHVHLLEWPERDIIFRINVQEIQMFHTGGGEELLEASQSHFDTVAVATLELSQHVEYVPRIGTSGRKDQNQYQTPNTRILLFDSCLVLDPCLKVTYHLSHNRNSNLVAHVITVSFAKGNICISTSVPQIQKKRVLWT